MLVRSREFAKGSKDGVGHHQLVKVFGCYHIFLHPSRIVQLFLAWPNTLALGAQLTSMLHCLGVVGIRDAARVMWAASVILTPAVKILDVSVSVPLHVYNMPITEFDRTCWSNDLLTPNMHGMQSLCIARLCTATTCGQVDMSNGCCSWDTDLELGVEHKLISCYVPGGDCYCDSACNNVTPDDCCSDVPESPTCTARKYIPWIA